MKASMILVLLGLAGARQLGTPCSSSSSLDKMPAVSTPDSQQNISPVTDARMLSGCLSQEQHSDLLHP
jgi:hypothetical protein